MQLSRIFALSATPILLIFSGAGCSERGMAPPVIETVGPPPARAEDGRLRVATANLWGVAVLGFDWADDIDERFAAMAEHLAANVPMLDVVLMQEVWKDTARRALLEHEGVSRNFPYRVDIAQQPGGAGLVVLSRFPIETARFHRFRAQGQCLKFWEGDCLSGKGIVVVQIRFGDRSVWIGDTHLIACYSRAGQPETACDQHDPNGDDRWHQIEDVRQTVAELVGDDPIVLGGDFNFTRTSRYYASMKNDVGDWTEPGEKVVVADRLDFLWTRPGRELRWHALRSVHPIFTEPVALRSGERVPLSDHPILATEICLVRIDDLENHCLPDRLVSSVRD
jgi:exonuclease III